MRGFLLVTLIFVAFWAWIYLANPEQRTATRKVLVKALPLIVLALVAALVFIGMAISTPGFSPF